MIDACSMMLADIVSRTSRNAACAWLALGDALNSATGLPGNSSLLTSQSSMFLNAPGIPRAYSGHETNSPSAGPEDGDGARRAMQQALRQAGVDASQVQHLNAHATSTPVGDKGELAAIKALFGTDSGLAISSTKSATGHLLGAAGGIEAIFTVLALRDQVVPATLNLQTPDAAAEGLNLIRGQAQHLPMEYALSNGFGFGGVNASVLFRRWI